MNTQFIKAEALVAGYVAEYAVQNAAAKKLSELVAVAGIGLRPLVDHITIRTLNVEQRAEEFLSAGFTEDLTLGVIEHDNWWAKVYRFPGQPAVFIDQAYDDARGNLSVIPHWVEVFGDKTLHHIAVSVDDIEKSIAALTKAGIEFAGEIVGEKGTALRQIFSKAEMKKEMAFSVLELAERHHGYIGFRSLQANALMESTR